MKRIFLSFLIFFVGSLLIQTKVLSYSSDPEGFISEVIDEAKVILSGSSSSEEKADKLSQIALKIVDIKGLAYYTLGKKRKELTPENYFKFVTEWINDGATIIGGCCEISPIHIGYICKMLELNGHNITFYAT